jgi:hypothetical protein
MRRHFALVVACSVLSGCVPEANGDAAHTPVVLPPSYSSLPPPPPGETIEAGKPVPLDHKQQEAVVTAVTRWMKNPGSVQFGSMDGARNKRGLIVVCGQVTGKNSAGSYVALSPFIGVLMGSEAHPDFVVVGIGSTGRERAEVASLCRESGVMQKA